jgi:hypothetical protein
MNVSDPVLYSYVLRGVGLFVALILFFFIEPRWASFLSTLGGGILFCAGVRSRRFAVRLIGLLLQCAGLYLFLDAVWYPFRASILLNSYFLGSCFIALSALFSAYYLENSSIGNSKRDRWSIFVLLFLGMAMWYAGGLREIYMNIVHPEQFNGVLLFISATSIIAGIIGDKIHWEKLHYILLLQLPIMLCVLTLALINGPVDYPLLIGWGTTVWPITFYVQFRILSVLDRLEWPTISAYYHLISLWMILFVSCREFILKVLQFQNVGVYSIIAVTVFVTLTWFFVARVMAKKRYWPVTEYPTLYMWGGGGGVALFMLGWLIKLALP